MQKTSSALWSDGKNMNLCSQLLVFFSKQVLGIIGSQIEIERIFYLTHILANLKKCHLQLENLENLIFVC
jgi:hypothetical protein